MVRLPSVTTYDQHVTRAKNNGCWRIKTGRRAEKKDSGMAQTGTTCELNPTSRFDAHEIETSGLEGSSLRDRSTRLNMGCGRSLGSIDVSHQGVIELIEVDNAGVRF